MLARKPDLTNGKSRRPLHACSSRKPDCGPKPRLYAARSVGRRSFRPGSLPEEARAGWCWASRKFGFALAPSAALKMAQWLHAHPLSLPTGGRDFRARFSVIEQTKDPLLAPCDDPENIVHERACSRLSATTKRHVSRLMDDSSRIMARDPCDLKESTYESDDPPFS